MNEISNIENNINIIQSQIPELSQLFKMKKISEMEIKITDLDRLMDGNSLI